MRLAIIGGWCIKNSPNNDIIVHSKFTVNRSGEIIVDFFSERFKQLKEQNNRTYPQIAEYLGLQPRTVKGYAANTIKPDYYKLLALADYFDVSLDYLVGRSDEPERR